MKFLDYHGLTKVWDKIKSWFVAKSGDTMTGRLTLQKALAQLVTGTGTAATSSTSGSTTTYYPAKWNYDLGISTPTPGDRLVIKTPVAGSDYGEYLSTDNGTTYYPVARNTGTTRLTNQYPAGAYICIVFEEYVSGSSAAGQVNDIFPIAGGTARVSQKIGCWRVINDYDSGNTVSQLRTENGRFRTGSTGVNSYTLVCLDKNGTFSMLTSSGSGTGTSKTINTSGKFKLDAVIFWYNGTATGANTLAASTYNTFSVYHAVDTRYSHNHTTTFTTNAPLYIECTIDEDGFWSPTTTCITQTLTSGKYYIFLGLTYSTEYQLSLMADHPVYYYDGTNLTEVPRLSKADRTKLDGIASGATKVESSTTNGKIKINGTDTTVYTHPAQTAYSAKGSATKVPKITTDSTGHVTSIEEVTISGVTPASHTHGNITNGGALQTNDITIASGDKLVVTDSSDSNKVARTSVSFDGSTTTTALTPKGTFEPFFKSNTGTTTLQSGTAVKVGTQNGADVNLKLPTIPAAANNGALKIGLNGGTASSKFTANQSGDSTLTFASGTTAGTIKVDGTEVAVAGWSGKQENLKIQLVEYGAVQYSDITTILTAGKIPAVVYNNALYICDGSVYTVNSVNEYRFTYASGNVDSPRIVFLKLRDSSAGWGGGVISLATPSSVTAVADSRFPYYTVDNPNWDDLTSIGEYKVTNSDSKGTAKNSPERGAINARVYNINDGSTPFITQIAVGDDMYYRSKYGNSAWSVWRYFTQSNTVRRIEQGSLGSATDTLYIV